jgi:hydroxyacylglutathione hydrolase
MDAQNTVSSGVPEPRVSELAPGLFQFVGVQRAAHVYLAVGSRRTVMFDSGLPGSRDYLLGCLRTLGLGPQDIDLLVLTHEHVDHAGGAPYFGQHCLTAAHAHAANKLRLLDEFSMMKGAFDQGIEAFHADIILNEGTVIDAGGLEFQVIHTPGHCSGSICLHERHHALLITADTIMANGVVGGVLNSGNVSDYITSLERLSRLRIDRLLPGHGKISSQPYDDIEVGAAKLKGMLEDSHALFNALRDTGQGFDDVVRSLRDLNAR